MHGHTEIEFNGVHFDGDGDCANVEHFEYAQDAEFTISFWLSKDLHECTDNSYEYLYSHHQDADTDQEMFKHAYINIYVTCIESAVIRYDLRDDDGHDNVLDYDVVAAGDFDAVTSVWLHVIIAVTPSSIVTYNDGKPVSDNVYITEQLLTENNAYPTPSTLAATMKSFSLSTDIHIGGRADRHTERYFRGRMALLQVLTVAVGRDVAECMFRTGDTTLPSPVAIYRHSGERIIL